MRVGRHRAGIASGRLRPSPVENHAAGHAVFANSFWRIAVLAAAGAMGATSFAEAAVYWSDSEPGFSRPGQQAPQRRQRSHRHVRTKTETPEKESAKPQGPLVIAISINKQKLRIYDANGFFAETPISTGMKGHPTPMGVFSVIEKDRYHHSNIYSGAPMPFMQRITWSGVAMHAGVLPGYAASHGCIRMPEAFAVKMWGWTKMGARVVVTPGEITPPESFSHPLLATAKVAPTPMAAAEPPADATPLREQTHTADASASLPATTAPVTMSDATQSGGNTSSHEVTTGETDHAPAVTGDAVSTRATDASIADVKSEAATSETAKSEEEPVAAKPSETASSEDRPAEIKSSGVATSEIKTPEVKSAETKPVETEASDKAGQKPDEAAVAAQANGDAAKTDASVGENVRVDEAKVEATADDVKTDASLSDTPKPVEAKPIEKSDDKVKPVTDGGAVADVKKDQARLPNTEKSATEKPAAAKPDPVTAAAPKRTGQIAVFVSRKDSKLYVRQNFKPLFNVPVTIAPDDRPLGTHVFTARVDKDDGNVLHWSVVSLPAQTRNAERRDEDERASRRRKTTVAVEVKAMPVPDSPTEALDRLNIPADVMARIAESLSTGGSIVVSDQGINAGETGEGTDFIVSLR